MQIRTQGESKVTADDITAMADEMIAIAKKKFVTGKTINEVMSAKIIARARLTKEAYPLDYKYYYDGNRVSLTTPAVNSPFKRILFQRYPFGQFARYEDPDFAMGNRIEDSNWVAFDGPRGVSLHKFFSDTAFNEKCRIHHIVAMGTWLESDWADGEWFQYPIPPKIDARAGSDRFRHEDEETPSEKTNYFYTVKECEGSYRHHPDAGGMVNLDGTVHSRVLIHSSENKEDKRELNVTAYSLADNTAFDLREDKDNSLKEDFIKQYRLSLTQKIGVHCSAGLGRTGHFILMMKMLEHRDKIFSCASAEEAVDYILEKIVKPMRKDRFCSIVVMNQLTYAIRNFVMLCQYAMEKGYDLNSPLTPVKKESVTTTSALDLAEKTGSSSLPFFASSSLEQPSANETPKGKSIGAGLLL